MEFHISRSARERYAVEDSLFNYTGNVIFGDLAASRRLARRMNEVRGADQPPATVVHAAALFAMGLIDELSHAMIARFRESVDPEVFRAAIDWFTPDGDRSKTEGLLAAFTADFPNTEVFRGKVTAAAWLNETVEGLPNREAAMEELLLLWLANRNPAFSPCKELVDDAPLAEETIYPKVVAGLPAFFATRPAFSAEDGTLLDVLLAPILASPDSLAGQLDFIRERWAPHLGDKLRSILLAIDVLQEEEIAIWRMFHPGGGAGDRSRFGGAKGWRDEGFEGDEYVGLRDGRDGSELEQQKPLHEYEAFSQDQAWMPNVVLIAKSTYVWLEQLSKKYGRHIFRLDQIPQEELQLLAGRGLNALWLIGLWERSTASQTIKRLRGQADAVASAYSLKDYRIADDLGGDQAYERLRDRAAAAGLRLASDMVPNHMGIDSNWVMEHPDWFISREESPFPSYSFEGPDLSVDSRYEIKIEDHYYDQSDAAVVFRLRQRSSGHSQFVYHGNDGTTFAWNDTAQLDYSKAYVREQVIQTILHVARLFPIIRFDAAMVLAKKHVQRLWFPLPGMGGSIPSRAENAMSQAEFDALMPHEFWREVVDRVAVEVPGTLLLAEAFWLLEGYFVRTLGMHRVYNSAFMNMLRDEENAKYRSYLKKTIEFDPEILKRYVNFMSNPDERTAIDQFGTGDKYFGTAVMLATVPGLPMFGHGQIEAFTEKYGMEYKQARFDESPNEDLVARHQREIAPLLKQRHIFAESSDFVLYDFWTAEGGVDENVFAYSNRSGDARSLVLFNNVYGSTHGSLHVSAAAMDKGSGELRQRSLLEGLGFASSDGVMVAYRDVTTNLEYLRRSTSLAHEGLSMPLRGYQYAVLLHWRELRATGDQPWDQLCDALGGAGVHSLEEALSKLRLRPLHEALRAVLAPELLEGLVKLSHLPEAEAADIYGEKPVPHEGSAKRKGRKASAPGETGTPVKDGAFAAIAERAEHFRTLVLKGSWNGHARGADDTQDGVAPASFAEMIAVATRVPRARRGAFPEAGPHASRSVLPSDSAADRAIAVWAPVVGWALLRQLAPSSQQALAMFDQLQLRSALAEIFSSLGVEGENAWRAAARVRALLLMSGEAGQPPAKLLTDARFWGDPDVRWLAGVSEAFGNSYVNKEQFEELVWWLQLPALVSQLSGGSMTERLRSIEEETLQIAEAAARASYEVKALQQEVSAMLPDRGEGETKGAVSSGKAGQGAQRGAVSTIAAATTAPGGRTSGGGGKAKAPAGVKASAASMNGSPKKQAKPNSSQPAGAKAARVKKAGTPSGRAVQADAKSDNGSAARPPASGGAKSKKANAPKPARKP